MSAAAERESTVTPGTSAVDAALEHICASPAFRNSPQQQRFLRHLVTSVQHGNVSALREMSLGVELFRRPAHEFDPKKDPIVRVEARRLRERLARYYSAEGLLAGVEIEVPLGSYVPVVRTRARVVPRSVIPPRVAALEQRAWYLMRMRSLEGYRAALDLFTRATAEHADFAAAYRGCAWARICIAGHEGLPPDSEHQRSAIHTAIERARAIDPTDAHLSTLRGAYAARYEHDFQAAYDLHEAGAAGAPGMSSMRTSLGWLHVLSGRFDEAEQVFQHAFSVDPFGFWHRHNLASLAYFRREFATAERVLLEALEMEPDHVMMRLLLARVLLCGGRSAEAMEHTQWCMAILPGMAGAELWHVAALAGAGHRDTARAALQAFERNGVAPTAFPVWRAMACTAIDQTDRAMEWLSIAADKRDYWLPNTSVDPAFDKLRSHAEFASVLTSAGLPFVA
ncbi:MAG: hypothetical protein M3Z31_08170 [Pseudomonadota bacterium]|nr:hypothetical protein [Pseudomonadota bacterium]